MKEFPCDVWFVRYSNHSLTSVSNHWPPIEKYRAIKETEKSITVTNMTGHYKTCHHKQVMKNNSHAFFWTEKEAKDFYLSKLQEKREQLRLEIDATYQNQTRWVEDNK